MRKKIFLSLMALLTITSLSAKSVWTESFNYAVGDLTTKTTQDDLSYLDYTNWYYQSQATAYTLLQVADTNLTYPNYCTNASGKAIKIAARGYKTGRQFADITSGSVFVSALVKINTLQGNVDTKEYFMGMAPDITSSKICAKVYTKKLSDGYQLAVAKFSEGSNYLSYTDKLNYGETYLIVVKYDIIEGTKNDFVSLYINPTSETTNPTVTCIREHPTNENNGSDKKDDAGSLSCVVINQVANTSRDMYIDEIKVATAWADLWEGGSEVKTPTLVVADDQKAYDFGELTQNMDEQSYNFTVTGTDLSAPITITKTNSDITVSPTSIAVADAAKGAKVTVTVAPTVLGEQSDVITLSSGTLTQKVTVNWKCIEYVDPTPQGALLLNGGFEEFEAKPQGILGTVTTYKDWTINAMAGISTEATDIKEGQNAFRTTSDLSMNTTIYQSVDMTSFAEGETFQLTLWYKVLTSKGDDLTLNCFWSEYSGTESGLDQDADKLQTVLPKSEGWTKYSVQTTKPAKGNRFEFKLKVLKKAEVLLDSFCLEKVESTEPWFVVLPEKNYYDVSADINTEKTVATLTIKQGNLTQPVKLELSGTGKDQFAIDKTQVTAAEEKVVVTYKPTKAGKCSAVLNITDDECTATTLQNTTISLLGSCTDPSKPVKLTLTEPQKKAFSCKVGESDSTKFTVSSENATDWVHAVIEVTQQVQAGSSFMLSDSYLTKNEEHTIKLTFTPQFEGDYAATVKVYTEGFADTLKFNVTGHADKGEDKPVVVDYATEFVWNTNNPYKNLNENFSEGATTYRNKTLAVTDWQNVVKKGTRAWWGYNTDSTTQAKATGYMFGVTEPTDAEMWLVTPALDYKNATKQVFSFKVMSDMLFEGQTHKLEVYFIDPSDPQDVFFQHIEELDELIPYADDELENTWYPLEVNLEGQEFIPDVFFMAFKYTDQACNNGGEYFITDVKWGEDKTTALPAFKANKKVRKLIQGNRMIIEIEGVRYNVLGAKE